MEITQEEKLKTQEAAEKYGLKFIILHGSYATGKNYPGSDLDVAVLGEKPPDFKIVLKLHSDLADIFGDGPERELDLKTLHNVDSLFRYLVIRDGILLYGDSTQYEEYKSFAYRDYMDSRDLRDLEYRMTLAKQEMLTKLYA